MVAHIITNSVYVYVYVYVYAYAYVYVYIYIYIQSPRPVKAYRMRNLYKYENVFPDSHYIAKWLGCTVPSILQGLDAHYTGPTLPTCKLFILQA